MKTYIYVKTHRVTGLKYLGKTQQDPYKYKGSGVYWTNHCKKHGYDEVDTEVLCECETPEEVKERGLYYSELWNVVESDEWANLTEETGAGFSSRQSTEIMKRRWEDHEFRKKFSDREKKRFEDPEERRKSSEQHKKRCDNHEYKKMKSKQALEQWEDPEFRKFQSEKGLGKKNPRYDHTVYHFVHESGTEERCTRYELRTKYSLGESLHAMIRGVRKSHKGWRVVKD